VTANLDISSLVNDIVKQDRKRAPRHAKVFICGVLFQYIYT